MTDKLLLAPGETAKSVAYQRDGTWNYTADDDEVQEQRRIGFRLGVAAGRREALLEVKTWLANVYGWDAVARFNGDMRHLNALLGEDGEE